MPVVLIIPAATSAAVNVVTAALDVGAGDGRLSYFLRCAMGEIHHVGLSECTVPPVESICRIMDNY